MAAESVIVLSAVLAIAAVTDAATGHIPNRLTFSLIAGGIGLGAVLHGGPGAAAATLGFLTGAALLLPWRLLGGMGSGDVKLLAGVGAFAGPRNVLSMFLATALIGGVLGLALFVIQRRARSSLRRLFDGLVLTIATQERRVVLGPAVTGEEDAKSKLPYALPIALGSLLIVAARFFSIHLPPPF